MSVTEVKSKLQKNTTVLSVHDGKYEIVKYTPEFKNQVLNLQKHHWGRTRSLNKTYLKWKYERNPYLNSPHIYLALYGEKVVGMRGFFGTKWWNGNPNSSIVVPTAGDSVIKPQHRNTGLFTILTNEALKDLCRQNYYYTFNLSAGRITFTNCLMMGWRSLGSLNQLRHDFHPSGNSSRFQSMLSHVPLTFIVKRKPFSNLDKNGHLLDNKITIERMPRPKSMAAIVKRVCSHEKMQHIRDKEFFNWRFQNPFAEYRFLFWENKHSRNQNSVSSELGGYLVLHTSPYRKKRHVSIVDWAFSSPQVEVDLLTAVIEVGKFDKTVVWSSGLSEKAQGFLQKLSFKKDKSFIGLKRHLPTILFKQLKENSYERNSVLSGENILDQTNWDLRMIYSDSY